jgi:hypothetical protein
VAYSAPGCGGVWGVGARIVRGVFFFFYGDLFDYLIMVGCDVGV